MSEYRDINAATAEAIDRRLSRVRTTLVALAGMAYQYQEADRPEQIADFAVLLRETAIRLHGQLDDVSEVLGGTRDGSPDEIDDPVTLILEGHERGGDHASD